MFFFINWTSLILKSIFKIIKNRNKIIWEVVIIIYKKIINSFESKDSF